MNDLLQRAGEALDLLNIAPDELQVSMADDPRLDAQRPALILRTSGEGTADHVLQRLRDIYPADHAVHVIRGLDEKHLTAEEADIGTVAADFEALYLPSLDPLADIRRFDGLFHIVVERLNAPDGCPWDNEQTHESLRSYLIEESYELIDAIERGEVDEIAEELGDVLLQILMHTAVGRRSGTFDFGDVTERISRKMIKRHPHVFGDAAYRPNWEELKKQENPDRSILDGVPPGLPALAASQTMQGRARKVGFDWPDIDGPLDKLLEEVTEFAKAETDHEREDEFGDILFVAVNIADHFGIEAEQALRRANRKFRARFIKLEDLAHRRGIDLRDAGLEALNALWDEAKELVQAG